MILYELREMLDNKRKIWACMSQKNSIYQEDDDKEKGQEEVDQVQHTTCKRD